ncbi:adenylate/guanylate cyclase domain-containing protein [Edaphocola flava]|uniref:adenylate/guanylate cyclase domain-containing protein n=1 Tax=Edaphocola flava TaxID=2499629 RepID=UPI00100BD642|nr:adenylate/guanylate cyclase domain-containing protein [Edaphocola flava]
MKRLLLFLTLLCHFLISAAEQKIDTIFLKDIPLQKTLSRMNFSIQTSTDENQNWKFRNADSSVFADPAYQDSHWSVRNSMSSGGENAYKELQQGVSWFRVPVVADTAQVGNVYTLLFRSNGAMRVYLDGKCIAQRGHFAKEGKADYLSMNKNPVFFTVAQTGVHMLAIQYENDLALKEQDSWGFSVVLFNTDDIMQMLRNNLILGSVALIGVGTLFFTLFFIHFLLFLFYRKEISNLYFALFNLSIAFLLYLVYYSTNAEKDISNNSYSILSIALSCITICFSLCAFTVTLFSKKKTFLKIVLALSLIVLALALFDPKDESGLSAYTMIALLVVSLVYTMVRIIIAIFKRVPGSLILGFGILFCLLFIIGLFITVFIAGNIKLNMLLTILFVLSIFSIPASISSFLAWRFATTNKNLSKQLVAVEQLSAEKQSILENQNITLEQEVVVRTQEVMRQKQALEEEKQKTDNLLLNILPHEVAEELKTKGSSKAQQFDEVSVLFTDFVNFTKISETLGVDELLEELNIHFTAFDRIMEQHGLEKIKTIGDAYLAVSGLPLANKMHAKNAVAAANDIIDFVAQRKLQVPYGLDIRIGIHSGPLIAGIIGVKKFAYDIWGDTVNTAARMEQNSIPGMINISESTYQLVQDYYPCTYRGKIEVKGKGALDMYFAGKPNPEI